MPSNVHPDLRPDRCDTYGGSALWIAVGFRLAVVGLAFGSMAALASSSHGGGGHSLFYGVAFGAFVATAIFIGGYLGQYFSDLEARRKLGERYGVEVRFGPASFQTRRIRVDRPPSDMVSAVRAAIQTIDPSVSVIREGENCLEALRPRAVLGPVISRIVATWERDASGAACVTVESTPGELTSLFSPQRDRLYADHGRSLENVEEFQLALRREIETAALAGGSGDEPLASSRSRN